MNYKSCKSYTLLELLIVVIIVGILASLAIPRFQKVVYRAHYAEMFNTIGLIARAKEIYYAEHGTYRGNTPGNEAYTDYDCFAGNGIPTGSRRVQQDLGIEVDENSFFQYLIYPNSSYPTLNYIYFKEPGYTWAWVYNYTAGTWWKYGDAGGRAQEYFNPPQ